MTTSTRTFANLAFVPLVVLVGYLITIIFRSNDQIAAEEIYKLPHVEAVGAAHKFVVGTWTENVEREQSTIAQLIGPKQKTYPMLDWLKNQRTKWEFRPDGVALEYSAKATDQKWSEPTQTHWEISTGQGEQGPNTYFVKITMPFMLKVDQKYFEYEIRSDGTIFRLNRGDNPHWSKQVSN